MIKLNIYFQQIVLACKGWGNEEYSTKDIIKRILSQYLSIRVEHINDEIIYRFLLLIGREVNKRGIEELLESMFKYGNLVEINDVINRLISLIASITVRQNGNEIIELKLDDNIINGVIK